MAVDLKAEVTRPLALLLAALAGLGWVMFLLSSWSAASTQKAQRLRIVELSEKTEALGSELARQVEASGSLADLQGKVAATREELGRVSQTRNDVQSDLLAAQRNLSGVRRELSEADRTLQSQASKLTDLKADAETTSTTPDVEPTVRSGRRGGRRWSRRGRQSRSYSVRSR